VENEKFQFSFFFFFGRCSTTVSAATAKKDLTTTQNMPHNPRNATQFSLPQRTCFQAQDRVFHENVPVKQ
jgi:hypothetical protein